MAALPKVEDADPGPFGLGAVPVATRRAVLELLRQAHLTVLLMHGQLTQQELGQARDAMASTPPLGRTAHNQETGRTGYVSARMVEAQLLVREARDLIGHHGAREWQLRFPNRWLDWLDGPADVLVLHDMRWNVQQSGAFAHDIAALFDRVARSSSELFATTPPLPSLRATGDSLEGWMKMYQALTGRDPRSTRVWPVFTLGVFAALFVCFCTVMQWM